MRTSVTRLRARKRKMEYGFWKISARNDPPSNKDEMS